MNFKAIFLSFVLSAAIAPLRAQQVHSPYSADSSYIFSSKLKFKEMTMQGYMAMKYQDACNFRVAVHSTLGNTLLDFEWNDGIFTEHFVVNQLNKRLIVNALKKDFELMFLQTLQKAKWKNDTIKKLRGHKYKLLQKGQKLITVTDRNWLGRQKRSLFFDYTNDDARLKSIRLKHHNFAMQVALTPIE